MPWPLQDLLQGRTCLIQVDAVATHGSGPIGLGEGLSCF